MTSDNSRQIIDDYNNCLPIYPDVEPSRDTVPSDKWYKLPEWTTPDKNPNIVEMDGGMKFDDDKLRWDLLPYDAVEKIVEIMTYGAKKYAPNNWQKVEAQRYYAALMRHLVAELKGEDYDQESGFLHLAHMACNALFLLWKKINKVK